MSAVALITGAACGIGAAVVRRLTDGGARCVLVDQDEDRVRRLAAELSAVAVPGDVRDPATSERAAAVAIERFGRLDLVHLNAGIKSSQADLEKLDLDAYRTITGVNVDAVVYGIRAVLPELRRHGGAIVVSASLAGLVGYDADPIYAMTKHAVVGLVRALADPLIKDGIRIGAVCPGFTDTEMIADQRPRFLEAGFPLLDAEDVAAAVESAFYAEEPGAVLVVQPGRPPVPYRFAGVPGPRTDGSRGARPPILG